MLNTGAIAGSQILGDVVRGAVGSAVTQGIGVATGLQDKFSWAGVAAAGVMAGIGGVVAREFQKGHYSKTGVETHKDGTTYKVGKGSWVPDEGASVSFSGQVLSGTASLLAGAATRSAIEGSNFGDNITAMLPDALGQVIGRAAGRAIDAADGGVLGAIKDILEAPVKLANTIGNLVASGIAGNGRSGATGAGDAKADQPTTGEGGGQNASNASSDSVSDVQADDIVVTARRRDAIYWTNDAAFQTINLKIGRDPGPLANDDDKRFGTPFRMQSGRTFLFGGAGNDPNLEYLPKWKSAFEAAGIGGVEITKGSFSYGDALGAPGGMVIDAANVVELNQMFSESYYKLGDFSRLNSYPGQINLVGYSYGAVVAAQKSLTLAYSGIKVDNVVLVGAPINQDLLDGLTSNRNIGRVTVINLSEYGDPIYAGMSDTSIALSAPKLVYQMLNGSGHFVYSVEGAVADQRRSLLGRILYQNGVR